MKSCGRCAALLAGVVASAIADQAFSQVEIVQIPLHPEYGALKPRALSGDGRTVVGFVTLPRRNMGMLWNRDRGFETVPDQSLEGSNVLVSVSHDGSVIAGVRTNADPAGFVWVRGQGVQVIRDPSGRPTSLYTNTVSGDGRYVTGRASGGTHSAFRWSTDGGFEFLAGVNGVQSREGGQLSYRGDAAVGMLSGGTAFYWTLAGGSQPIPTPEGHARPTIAWITGRGDAFFSTASEPRANTEHLYTWNTDTGATILATRVGRHAVRGVSADGRVFVGGTESLGPNRRGRIWTLGAGLEFIGEYLRRFGVDYPNEMFIDALAVSGDGRTILIDEEAGSGRLIVLPPTRVADFNRDEVVDEDDLRDFVACFQGEGILPVSTADLNGDGFTDFLDLMEFLSDY